MTQAPSVRDVRPDQPEILPVERNVWDLSTEVLNAEFAQLEVGSHRTLTQDWTSEGHVLLSRPN